MLEEEILAPVPSVFVEILLKNMPAYTGAFRDAP